MSASKFAHDAPPDKRSRATSRALANALCKHFTSDQRIPITQPGDLQFHFLDGNNGTCRTLKTRNFVWNGVFGAPFHQLPFNSRLTARGATAGGRFSRRILIHPSESSDALHPLRSINKRRLKKTQKMIRRTEQTWRMRWGGDLSNKDSAMHALSQFAPFSFWQRMKNQN